MAPSWAPAGSATDGARGAGVTVAIALGSNLGDRDAHLTFAVERLAGFLHDLRVSSFHETEPEDGATEPHFLNAAAVGRCRLGPRAVLDRLLTIELERGRERSYPGAARTLDLDLILYGDRVIDEPDLRVPHPRFRRRRFVLAPLVEVGAHLVDPVTGKTIRDLSECS